MKLCLATALAVLISPAASLAVEDVDGSFAKLAPHHRAAFVELLDLNLADGPATRLRNVRVVQSDRLCGMANAKNAMGAYTGYRRFFADLGRREMHLAGEDMPPGKGEQYADLMTVGCTRINDRPPAP